MKTLKALEFSLFAILALAVSGVAMADRPSTHGMLLFGSKTAYASHLPMFHSPHDYQLLLKLRLAETTGGKSLVAYERAKASGETLFTLVPEPMDLTLVINGTKASFGATIFEGHFERGGTELGPVTVQVEKIIFSSKLNGGQPVGPNDDYLVFGENGEYFAVHVIQERPSFDFVAAVQQPYTLTFRSCRTRACDEPARKPVPDASLPVTLSQSKNPSTPKIPLVGTSIGGLGEPLTDVQKVIYVEEAELAH